MVSAIGSSTSYSGPADTSLSTAGLEAQIDRYQDELSNCVNCSSAKTLEGKEKIQSIANKISALKARIQEIESAKSNAQPAQSKEKASAYVPANKDVSITQYGYSSATVPATGSKTATVGNRLDVFA